MFKYQLFIECGSIEILFLRQRETCYLLAMMQKLNGHKFAMNFFCLKIKKSFLAILLYDILHNNSGNLYK